MTGLLHDFGTRVVVLVDAVTKTHQPERIIPVLGAFDIFGNTVHAADFAQHVERRFIGAAMCGTPQAGNAGRNAGKRDLRPKSQPAARSMWMRFVRGLHAG